MNSARNTQPAFTTDSAGHAYIAFDTDYRRHLAFVVVAVAAMVFQSTVLFVGAVLAIAVLALSGLAKDQGFAHRKWHQAVDQVTVGSRVFTLREGDRVVRFSDVVSEPGSDASGQYHGVWRVQVTTARGRVRFGFLLQGDAERSATRLERSLRDAIVAAGE